jgi:hypothetical protein
MFCFNPPQLTLFWHLILKENTRKHLQINELPISWSNIVILVGISTCWLNLRTLWIEKHSHGKSPCLITKKKHVA